MIDCLLQDSITETSKLVEKKIIIQNIIIIKATLARPTRRAETSMTRFELFENWRQRYTFCVLSTFIFITRWSQYEPYS